jgi:hypothetical protein
MNEDIFKRAEAVGRAEAQFREIRIDLRDQRKLAAVGLEMLYTSLNTPVGKPRPGMIVSEPAGAGKSEAANKLVLMAEQATGSLPGKGPAKLVTLDTVGSVKSVWSSILEGLGDPNYNAGDETLQLKRVKKALSRESVDVLVLDEFNHLADSTQGKRGANAVKNLLTAGWVAVVVMGTSNELDGMADNPGYERRMMKSPGLPARTWKNDSESWTAFLGELDEQIVARRILTGRAGLDREAVAMALCSVCCGMVGDAHWIVLESLKDAVRRGASSITLRDVATNADALMRKRKRGGTNGLSLLL